MSQHSPASVMENFYAIERKFMASQSSEDEAKMLSYFSPEMTLYQSPALPWGGVSHGIEGVQKWGQQMSDTYDIVDVQNPEYFEKSGSDEVLVKSTLKLRVRKNQREMSYPFVQIVRIDVERGLITEIRPFHFDVHGLLVALE